MRGDRKGRGVGELDRYIPWRTSFRGTELVFRLLVLAYLVMYIRRKDADFKAISCTTYSLHV